jgi:hypothetical protein
MIDRIGREFASIFFAIFAFFLDRHSPASAGRRLSRLFPLAY